MKKNDEQLFQNGFKMMKNWGKIGRKRGRMVENCEKKVKN